MIAVALALVDDVFEFGVLILHPMIIPRPDPILSISIRVTLQRLPPRSPIILPILILRPSKKWVLIIRVQQMILYIVKRVKILGEGQVDTVI